MGGLYARSQLVRSIAVPQTRNFFKDYLHYTAHLEAPDRMHFWCAAVAVAGALRRRTWIEMGEFQWVPNFYVVLVAPPGVVAKSTTAGVAMRLLREIPGINFGPDAATWQSLVQAIEAAQEQVEIDGEYHPMACVTLALSEFGTLLDTENKQLIDVLTALWDGSKGTWNKTTKTQGNNTIVNPWINMIACTTPAWMQGNFSQQAVGGGFVSRCVFVYADKKRHLRALPDEHLPEDHKAIRSKLVSDLLRIAEMRGPFTILPEARAWIREWYRRHNEERHLRSANELLSGYVERKQVQLLKLAMVVSAAHGDSRQIALSDIEFAHGMVTALELDLPRVFSHMNGMRDRPMGAVLEIEKLLEQRKELPYAEAFQQFYSRMTSRDFDAMLRNGALAGVLTLVSRNGTTFICKPRIQGGGSPEAGGGSSPESAEGFRPDRSDRA
jgi:hypothetical protein